MSFSKLALNPAITKALDELGYQSPTPIQEKAIPLILKGKDIIAAAQTGTGKTASFVLPLLEKLHQQQLAGAEPAKPKRVRVLILAPTRELVMQIDNNIKAYSKHLPFNSLAMYGGVSDEAQKQALLKGVDLLVATPGRLLDMYTQRAIHFNDIQTLVLDEADRMLDMGFIGDINKVLDRLPERRQSLLFSATLSKQVRDLAKTAVPYAVEIKIAKTDKKPNIIQSVIPVDKDKKSALLSKLITEKKWQQALIFIETKRGAAKLVDQLAKRGISAESFHSGRSQAVREQLLADFKDNKLAFLIATGVASRGIDIENLTRVVNYDLPDQADDYVHRIGRTGRAGAVGEAISLVSRDDFRSLCYVEKRLGAEIPRTEIADFEPKKPLPPSDIHFDKKQKAKRNKTTNGPAKKRDWRNKPRNKA